MSFTTYPNQPSTIYSYPLVASVRHELFCKPGMYRVVFCVDSWMPECCFDAVIDDFGSLVRTSE